MTQFINWKRLLRYWNRACFIVPLLVNCYIIQHLYEEEIELYLN